ncbi:MAG TPA: hypothetical protein VGH92_03980 [Gaiellaceae bacterium]
MLRTSRTRKTRLLAALAAVVALAALAGAPSASAAPAATAKATSKCWLQVVNDWLAHGSVKGYYAIPCYTQAIQNLSSYPDIKQYSSAIDDIRRALLVAIHEDRGNGPGSSSGGGGGPSGGGGPVGNGGGNGPTGGGTAASHKSILNRVAADIGPGNAQSIPLPLLVLGGLAVLLLLTAAATWLARRLQARRVAPAPAIAKRR